MLALAVLLPSLPSIPVYAQKTQIAVGGGKDIDIIYTTETAGDVTTLFPMNVININDNLNISSDKIKELTKGDIELSLPHMVSYENVDSKVGFSANQSASTKYREAITWLSENDKLHLPETVNFSYAPFKAELPKTNSNSSPGSELYDESKRTKMVYPLNQGNYVFSFRVSENKYDLKGDVDVYLNGTCILSEQDVYDRTVTTKFTVGTTATLEVKVKEEKFTDEKGVEHKTPWGHNTGINQNLKYPSTYTPTNVDKVVTYKTTYDNIYANPNTSMTKSQFIMNMMKVVDEVQYSRPLLVNSAYTKKLNNNTTQHISFETLEQSPYAKYAGQFGVDVASSQVMVDYTHFGTRLFFTTPNVYENYIERALEKGIIKSNELNENNAATIELYAKFGGYVPAYSSTNTPVRYNYPSTYDPLGIVSGKMLDSTRLETLWRLQLIPQNMNFSSVLAQEASDAENNINRSFLGRGYDYDGIPKTYVASQTNMSELLRNTDNLETFVKGNSLLLDYLKNLKKVEYNPKQPFTNTYTVNNNTGTDIQLNTIKPLVVTNTTAENYESPTTFFTNENLELIDALRILYDAVQVFSEPTLTKLEIDTVNSRFGVQLNSVNADDKEMLEYFFAKGILNPEESGILNLYQKLNNDLALQILYRVANPQARYTIKTDLSSTDTQLLDKGYSQIQANKVAGSNNVAAGKPVVPSAENVVYVRLEELFLKDKNGNAYYDASNLNPTSNRTYNPSSYNFDNNLFGLYSPFNSGNLMIFKPKLSIYFLGTVEIDYKRESDGVNRKTIWLKFSLPKNFVASDYTFDSAGNKSELPKTVTGFSNKGGYYYVPKSQKLNYLGVNRDFDLRNGTCNITGQGSLSFSYTNKPLVSGDTEDMEDVYQLWRKLNPSSAERLESGSYVISTGEQVAPGNEPDSTDSFIEDGMASLSSSFLNSMGLSMDVYATTNTPSNGTPANTNTNTFTFSQGDAKLIRFNNYKLFNSTGTTLNPDAEQEMKDKFQIIPTVQSVDPTTGQITVLFASTEKQGINLTSFVEQNIKVSIPTDGTVPIGLMYFKYDDGTGNLKTLVSETALATFGIKVFKDSDSNTKVLQNKDTGVYAVLSDGTNTCIIGNEFRHYDESQGMIEITDNGIYYNFDIIKKLMSYNNIAKIDATIVADELEVISTKSKEVNNYKLTYNGVDVDIKPLMYKDETGEFYLNLNSVGYGASYIMRTWDSTDGEYTMLIEYKYSDLPTTVPDAGTLISPSHTLGKGSYGKYNKILEEHFSNVFLDNAEALKRLALSNLVLHWSLYDDAKLPETIKENYINNPYVEPVFTLFKDGERIEPDKSADLLNEIYLTLSKVSKVAKISSATTTKSKTYSMGNLLTEDNYLSNRFSTDSRTWKFDNYKHQLVLKLNKNDVTPIGDVNFSLGASTSNPVIKAVTKPRYTGFSEDQIPIHSEAYVWASTSKDITYTMNGRLFRAYGPNLIVGTNDVQYLFDSLISIPLEVTPSDTSKLKVTMTGADVDSAFANGALFKQIKPIYAEYPYNYENIRDNTINFLEGDPAKAADIKLNFISPSNNWLKTMLVDSSGTTIALKGIIYSRSPNGNLKAHYYYGIGSGTQKPIISTTPLTDDQLKDAVTNGTKFYVQYNYLIGITDLYRDKADVTRQNIKFAKPKYNYFETIDPVLDINTTIAKSLLSSKLYDNYFVNKNGTTGTVASDSGKIYLKDLDVGDVLILRDKGSVGSTDIVTITSQPVSQKYVPVVGLMGSNSNTLSPIEAIREGKSRVLLNNIIDKKMYITGSIIPLSKLVDINSVQIATDSDFKNYMRFYATLAARESFGDASNPDNLRSIFNASNEAFKNGLLDTLTRAVESNTMKFLVQATLADSTKLKSVEYTENWKLIDSKDIAETEYETTGYSYLARYDMYPYVEVEWVADYAEMPYNGQTKAVYRISGVNTASGQNVSAFSDYANYLKEDFNSINKIFGKQKLWDKYFLASGMLTADDLDAYVNSITPDYDRVTQEAKKTKYWVEGLLGMLLVTTQVILILWGILLLTCYVLCKFSLGRLFVYKFKLLKILTFNRDPNPYDVNTKKGIVLSIAFLAIVVTVFYSGTWRVLGEAAVTIKNIFTILYDYIKAISKIN